MLLIDREICHRASKGMIYPFQDSLVSKLDDNRVISFGCSSAGYDARLGNKFSIFKKSNQVIDPKNPPVASDFDEVVGNECIIPPNNYALAHTVEYFNVPRDILVLCIGKSTYARCGILINVTPLEPGWCGQVTLEIANLTPCPAKIYAGEGICQFLFYKTDGECWTSYADRKGKYQDQWGVTLARM
jgi:dCTP deaminase